MGVKVAAQYGGMSAFAEVSFNKDKTLTSTGQTGITGLGIWEKVGNREYMATGVQVIGPNDPNFLPGTYLT